MNRIMPFLVGVALGAALMHGGSGRTAHAGHAQEAQAPLYGSFAVCPTCKQPVGSGQRVGRMKSRDIGWEREG